METTLKQVCDALDKLGNSVQAKSNEKRLYSEMYGWNYPSISITDIANLPMELSKQIRKADVDEVSDELKRTLKTIPQKLQQLENRTVPQIIGTNASQAFPAYMATIEWVSSVIQPVLAWETMKDPKLMPSKLARRLRTLHSQLEKISVDKEELLSHIKVIHDATETAESLPADLEALKEARESVLNLSSQSVKDAAKIGELKDKAIANDAQINNKITKADKLINQSEEAYRVATTKGLAGAFEERAKRLTASMWVWVVGLLIALTIGAFIGSDRLNHLTNAMNATNPKVGIIMLQSFLSILSIGAPLWFAWLATKQIGQRFKLSEDYAFKSSVAKAYEGYRKEAARIDPVFEARLFSTALTRVEEAPLRLVDDENHGSPWNELINSAAFNKALDTIPEFREKFIQIAKDGKNSVKGIPNRKDKTTELEDPSEST